MLSSYLVDLYLSVSGPCNGDIIKDVGVPVFALFIMLFVYLLLLLCCRGDQVIPVSAILHICRFLHVNCC